MISTKERALLKSKSHELKDNVYVGKEGVTDNVIKQIEDNLYAHEMVKIKVQQTSDASAKEIAESMADRVGADIVGVVGSKIILYKHTDKLGFRHYL